MAIQNSTHTPLFDQRENKAMERKNKIKGLHVTIVTYAN
jgi:hypothetical protein